MPPHGVDTLSAAAHPILARCALPTQCVSTPCGGIDCFVYAAGFLQALGGAANIESINNCATRLRIALVDMTKTQSDDVFKALGAHGVVRRGNGIQVIVGLHVPQVRDQLESLMKTPLTNEQTTLTEAIS